MTVRELTAAHNLDCAVGALSTGTFGTIAAIVKRGSVGSWSTIYGVHASGGSTPRNQFAFNPANNILLWQDPNSNSSIGPLWSNTDDWALFVVRKATGAGITPRFSLYNFTTGLWTHAAGTGSALENWATSPGGVVRFNWAGGDNFVGRIAVRAAWNSLPWAATAGGDTAIVAAGLHTSAANWLAASPNAMWLFNQAAVTDAVTDVTGGGADQTARTGTTVIAGDDPPGFDFSLEAGGEFDVDGDVTATATITADTEVDQAIFVFAEITAEAEVAPPAPGIVDVDATITATASLTAIASVDRVGQASFTATATISAEAQVLGNPDVAAELSVVAALTATSAADLQAQAAMTVVTTIAASAIIASDPMNGPVDLHFIALAPVLVHGDALAPQLTERLALAPELDHGDAGEPDTAHGDPAVPALDHGESGAPELTHGQLEDDLVHGTVGEPSH